MGIKGFLYFIISAYLVFTVYLIIYNLNTGEVEFNTIIFQQNTGNGALPPAVVDPHTVLDETEEAVVPVWKERAAAGWAPTKTKKEEEIIEQFLDTASNKYVPEFVLNQPEACKGANSSSVIVVVPTSFSNHRSRSFIRGSWGNSSYNPNHNPFHKVLFLLGSYSNQTLMEEVKQESELYEDLIQIDALDSYENLTYKSVSILFWSREFCASAGWVIKSDDDIIVNPFNFAKQFPPEYIESTTWQPLIYGLVMPHSKVSRTGKWAMPVELYPSTHYPPYAQGYAYILTKKSVSLLLDTFRQNKAPMIWVEDSYITGLLRKEVSTIQLVNLRPYFIPTLAMVFGSKMLLSHTIFLHTLVHGENVDSIKEWYWTKILDKFQIEPAPIIQSRELS